MVNWDIDKIIQDVIHIAKEAGDKILEVYEDIENFDVELKKDDSPLTRADREANKIICSGLEALAEKWPIISEENKAIPFDERKNFDYVWMVDPLDGTKEFIKRNGEFTVNIALIHQNRSIAGVVHAPVLKTTYYASKGKGAFKVSNGTIKKLKVKTFSKRDPQLKVVCSRSHLNEATQIFIDLLEKPEKVSRGSSLKFLIVAEGEAHIYPRLAPTMEWDTAAAHIILEEAGGSVLKAGDNIVLNYNKADLLNPHFVASGNEII